MTRHAAIAMILCVTSAAAAQGLTARLAPADPQPQNLRRPATLTIKNQTDSLARAVRLRWQQGGPAFIYPLSVAPHQETATAVLLPAAALVQTYDVTLLVDASASAAAIASGKTDIQWKLDQVRNDLLLDSELYAPWWDAIPSWPPELLRLTFWAGTIFLVAAGACLFFTRPLLRLTAVAVLSVAAATGAWAFLSSRPTMIDRVSPNGQPLLIRTTLRTTTWHDSAELLPVYYSKAQMAADTTVIQSGEGTTTTLRPQDVRIFRK
ncbi:MAG: hypothetical protein ABFD92_14740 [Planctomycetaceae bacterium]|nr:hypothetical protein [Planctomycetaceae bacterium]